MKRLICGLAMCTMTAISWAGQDGLAPGEHPAMFCEYKDVCEKVAKKEKWPTQKEVKGITYGTFHYTFTLPASDKEIRLLDHSVVIKLKTGGAFTYGMTDELEGSFDALRYAFTHPSKNLPETLPVNALALGVMYSLKTFFPEDAQLKQYEKGDWLVFAANSKKAGIHFIIGNKKYKSQVLKGRMNQELATYFDQFISTLSSI